MCVGFKLSGFILPIMVFPRDCRFWAAIGVLGFAGRFVFRDEAP